MFKSSEIAERQVWREVVMDAVDLLLRQTDRRMKEDSKEAFASGNIGAVLIVDANKRSCATYKSGCTRSAQPGYRLHPFPLVLGLAPTKCRAS